MEWHEIEEYISELERIGYDYSQIFYVYKGLMENIDISRYSPSIYESSQMEQIYLGLSHGIDTSCYENPEFTSKKMKVIRIAIETSTYSDEMIEPDVSEYEAYRISKDNGAIYGPTKHFKKERIIEESPELISDEVLENISIDSLFVEDETDISFDDFTFDKEQTNEVSFMNEHQQFYEQYLDTKTDNFFYSTYMRYPLLNAEEEIKIAYELSEGNMKSWDRFLLSNIRLVLNISRQYSTNSLSKEDLFQFGIFGLIKSMERFDPEYGNRFSTYAVNWIRQQITRSISDYDGIIRIPVHLQEQLRKFDKLSSDINGNQSYEIAKNNYNKVNEELTVEEYETYLYVKRINDTVPITNELLDSNFYYYINHDQELLKNEINNILDSTLSDREKQVIRYRFGFDDGVPKTLEEIGSIFDVTRERIRQIEANALRKLNTASIRKKLKAFL